MEEPDQETLDKLLKEWEIEESKNIQIIKSTCEKCQTINCKLHPLYKDTFKRNICRSCIQEFPTLYRLAATATLKKDFLLNDTDLIHLPFLEKRNEKYNSFHPMRLYMYEDVSIYILYIYIYILHIYIYVGT